MRDSNMSFDNLLADPFFINLHKKWDFVLILFCSFSFFSFLFPFLMFFIKNLPNHSSPPWVRASPPHTGKQFLYFTIEYGLMTTVPTHKRPSKHSKTIYVFTYWRVLSLSKSILEKSFKDIKMTTTKWTIGEQKDLLYPAARFNEKECLPVWGGDALRSVH